MVVITDVRVPADALLGEILGRNPNVEIELERLVPLQEGIAPLFWVEDGSVDAVEKTVEESDANNDITRLVEGESRVLYEFELAETNDFVRALVESRGRLLEAEGSADAWEFRIQFVDRSDVTAFRDACERRGLAVTLRRLYNPTTPESGSPLTSKQVEALTTAYRAGYFDVPRRVTMGELAEEFGISNSAFSQRLRRGTAALVAETLLPDGETR